MNVTEINSANIIQKMDMLSQQATGSVNPTSPTVGGDSFKAYFNQAIHSVNNEQIDASKAKVQYTEGNPNMSLSRVMVEMQKAEISLTALVTVRNKLLEGYKTIMEMSV